MSTYHWRRRLWFSLMPIYDLTKMNTEIVKPVVSVPGRRKGKICPLSCKFYWSKNKMATSKIILGPAHPYDRVGHMKFVRYCSRQQWLLLWAIHPQWVTQLPPTTHHPPRPPPPTSHPHPHPHPHHPPPPPNPTHTHPTPTTPPTHNPQATMLQVILIQHDNKCYSVIMPYSDNWITSTLCLSSLTLI